MLFSLLEIFRNKKFVGVYLFIYFKRERESTHMSVHTREGHRESRDQSHNLEIIT